MTRQTPSARALLALLALALAGSPAAAADEPATLKQWIRGPVRYIARPDEMKAFKKLKDDNDRALFVERFWARRDPTPDTMTNEYRQLFWERVQQANTQFIDSPRPGWMTDRGKVFILYGGPTEIRDYPNLDSGSSPTAGRGVLRWIYDGRPGGRRDLDAVVVVPFVRDVGGEYKLSYDPKLSSVFFDEFAIRERRDAGMERFAEMLGAPRRTELSVMLDLGKLQEVPPQAQVLLERVETAESYRTIPLATSVRRYRGGSPDDVVVVLTVGVDWVDEGDTPSTIARFTPLEATERQRVLGEDSFTLLDGPEGRVAEARVRLSPGRWNLTLISIDPATARTGMERRTIDVPSADGELTLSDLSWAAALEPLDYAALSSYDEPYHVGPFRVVARVGERVALGRPLTVFYEIEGGAPPYRIRYTLYGREADGRWTALGEPTETASSVPGQGWEFATSERWPTGRYRIEVDVNDAAGASVARSIEAELVEPAAIDDAEADEGVPVPAPAGGAG